MSLTSAILGGLLLGLFMAISVGPTLFAIIKYSLNHSYKTGLAFVFGVSVSDIIYVTIANLAAPWLQFVYKYEKQVAIGGGVLLIAVGAWGLIKKFTPRRPSSTPIVIGNGHYFRIFASGFLINTINPGVIINWLAAVTLTANATASYDATQGLIYRIVFFGCCLGLVLSIDVLKVILADSIRKRLTIRKVMYLQRISSGCLLLIGIGLVIFAVVKGQIDPNELQPKAANTVINKN